MKILTKHKVISAKDDCLSSQSFVDNFYVIFNGSDSLQTDKTSFYVSNGCHGTVKRLSFLATIWVTLLF